MSEEIPSQGLLDGLARLCRPGRLPVDQPQLVTTSIPDDAEFLRAAAADGDVYAMQKLGLEWPAPAADTALFVESAERGNVFAQIRLGARLIGGIGLPRNRRGGLTWLRRAGALTPRDIGALGTYLYLKSRSLAPVDSAGLVSEAAALSEEAIDQGATEAGIFLAYLLRRAEVESTRFSIDELLAPHVRDRQPFAVVNQALRLAREDWDAADLLMAQLTSSADVLDWWCARSREGDSEGDLVIAFLCRHGFATDPDGFSLAERLRRASSWLNEHRSE